MEKILRKLIVETVAEDRRVDLLAGIDGFDRDDDGVLRDDDGNRATYNANGDLVSLDDDGKVVVVDDDAANDETTSDLLDAYDAASDKGAYFDSLDSNERDHLRAALADRRNR